MGLRAARALHLALILLGAGLYLVFVLPRWWVLTGDVPPGLATAGRLLAGIPIALSALPVLAILRQTLGRKIKVPELALRLRAWSAVLHVVAGALILVTAVVEIWLRLAVGGPYLFAVYGAAASIAILGVLALYLSFVAEKPPTAPKPPKTKKVKAEKVKAVKAPRGKKHETPDDVVVTTEDDPVVTTEDDLVVTTEDDLVVTTEDDVVVTTDADTVIEVDEGVTTVDTVVTETLSEPVEPGGLRNKRPDGKRRNRLGR